MPEKGNDGQIFAAPSKAAWGFENFRRPPACRRSEARASSQPTSECRSGFTRDRSRHKAAPTQSASDVYS
jgi:hypothetical protein